MDTIPRKWFSLSDAFDHFADPESLRRLQELEPHARSYNKHTEHLHKECRKISRMIHLALIERLKNGELIARGLNKYGGFDEGIVDIAPKRWSVLRVSSYERNEVSAPIGLSLVDVEICEASTSPAAERQKSEHDPSNGFEHSPDYRQVRINGLEFSLGRKQAEIVRHLHAASQTDEPWVHGKMLRGGKIQSSIRDLFKHKENWEKLIESDGSGYYRLNLPPTPKS